MSKNKERRDSAPNSEEFASVTTSIRDSQRNSNDTRVSSSQSSVRQSTNVSSTSRTSKLWTKSGKVKYKEVKNEIKKVEEMLENDEWQKKLSGYTSDTVEINKSIGKSLLKLKHLDDESFKKRIEKIATSVEKDRTEWEEKLLNKVKQLEEALEDEKKKKEEQLKTGNGNRKGPLFVRIFLYCLAWLTRKKEKEKDIEDMADRMEYIKKKTNTLKLYHKQYLEILKNPIVRNLLGDNPTNAEIYHDYVHHYLPLLNESEGTVNDEKVEQMFTKIEDLIKEKNDTPPLDQEELLKKLNKISSKEQGIQAVFIKHKREMEQWKEEIKSFKTRIRVLQMDLQGMRTRAALGGTNRSDEDIAAQEKRKKDLIKAEKLVKAMKKRLSHHKKYTEAIKAMTLKEIFLYYNPFDENDIRGDEDDIHGKVISDLGELKEEKIESIVEKIGEKLTEDKLNAANQYKENPEEKEKDIERKAKKLLGEQPDDLERLREKNSQLSFFSKEEKRLREKLLRIKTLRKVIHANIDLTKIKETNRRTQPSATRDKEIKLYSLLRKMDVIEENINLFLAFNTMRTKVMKEQPDEKPLNVVQIVKKRTMGAASAFTKSVVGSMYGGSMYGGSMYEGSEYGDGNSQYSDFPDNEHNNSLYLDNEEGYESEDTEFEKKENKRKVKKGMLRKFFGKSKTTKSEYQEGQVRVPPGRFPLPNGNRKRKKRFGGLF